MTHIHELSDDDLLVMLLIQEIRRQDDHIRKERLLKNEVMARYERLVAEKQALETQVALLQADVGRVRIGVVP